LTTRVLAAIGVLDAISVAEKSMGRAQYPEQLSNEDRGRTSRGIKVKVYGPFLPSMASTADEDVWRVKEVQNFTVKDGGGGS
jgi:hypothetical protein